MFIKVRKKYKKNKDSRFKEIKSKKFYNSLYSRLLYF